MERYEVVIIGGGTMGTAVAWALGKRGISALMLEQFSHVHNQGSHSGYTRIIRHAYAEGEAYVPLVQRADQLWLELSAAIGTEILIRTGGLDISSGSGTQAAGARASAEKWNLSHEWLTAAEINHRWPVFNFADDWQACYSPDAGFILVEPALHGMATLAKGLGVAIHDNEPVRHWQPDGNGYRITTDQGTYLAAKLIISAGAWNIRLLHNLGLPLTVRRKTLFWFDVADPAPFTPKRMPVFMSDDGHDGVYGFPIWEQPGFKIANHRGGQKTDPDTIDRQIHPGEEADLARFIDQCINGATTRVIDSAVCMYTMTPDEHFIVDRHPHLPGVAMAAGFSGHGFKFATQIGELLADLALDATVQAPRQIALNRFDRAVVR